MINSIISHDGSVRRTAEEDIRLADFGQRFTMEPETSENTPSEPRSPFLPPGASQGEYPTRHDYNMQLMVLEQQNKKRLMMSRAEQTANRETSENTPSRPRSHSPPRGASQGEYPTRHDYNMQLMVLEQENKKRLMMARAEQTANREALVVPPSEPVLRAPVFNSSISIVSNDGEEVVAAAQEIQAHTLIMEDDKRPVGFIGNDHGAMHSEVDELLSRGLIHRNRLEMLFCPNDVLISRDSGLLSAFVLRSCLFGHSTLTLDCWSWGFDGQRFRRKSALKTLARPLEDTVGIRDLDFYPLNYASEEDICKLQARGQKFWDLRYKNIASYEGWDLRAEQNYSNEARCIIDYRAYRRFHPQAEAFQFSDKPLAPSDRWPETIPHDATPDKNLIILLPPFIHGFFLKEKKWETLIVDNVGPVIWNKDAFERLVLPKKTKDLVKGLVMVRTPKLGEKQGMSLSGKRKRDDLIVGKGNGLIMLLHGGPGTGKTLTAESVAELAEMPLYNVTCGDIGTSADAVEKYLQTALVLGKTWNCVLLLDEADFFLEQRSLSDLERNSLLSVFLRTLEYYDGISILTSNRVGTFDEAFKSHIQVALHYPNLDRVARKKIWKNFFDMMEVDEEDVNLEDLNKHIKELADQDMNGREIRNALTTARQIALFQKETLAWEHVEQAITTANVFNKYLGTVHGHTDDQYARDQEFR